MYVSNFESQIYLQKDSSQLVPRSSNYKHRSKMLVKVFLQKVFYRAEKMLEMAVSFRLQNFRFTVAYEFDFSYVRGDLTDPGDLHRLWRQKFFFINGKK